MGKSNHVKRSFPPITYGQAQLRIGRWAKITTGHTLDLTRSIAIGDRAVVAGKATQFWTHGYYHPPVPSERFRVDGRIWIGENVYVGSACVVSAGVRVADNVMIGAHSSVAKSIEEAGLYVSQPLRRVELNIEEVKSRLNSLPEGTSCEAVLSKDRR